jgi:hypothetical protein
VNPCIAVGYGVQLTAIGTFADGSTQDLTADSQLIGTPGSTVASVSPTGLVTWLTNGITSSQTSATVEGITKIAFNNRNYTVD